MPGSRRSDQANQMIFQARYPSIDLTWPPASDLNQRAERPSKTASRKASPPTEPAESSQRCYARKLQEAQQPCVLKCRARWLLAEHTGRQIRKNSPALSSKKIPNVSTDINPHM